MASEFPINRKDLWNSRGNITIEDWFRACRKLGLPLTKPTSGTSHYAVRKPSEPVDLGVNGLIATIYPGMRKEVNGIVFKRFLEYGVAEDSLWRALGKLK